MGWGGSPSRIPPLSPGSLSFVGGPPFHVPPFIPGSLTFWDGMDPLSHIPPPFRIRLCTWNPRNPRASSPGSAAAPRASRRHRATMLPVGCNSGSLRGTGQEKLFIPNSYCSHPAGRPFSLPPGAGLGFQPEISVRRYKKSYLAPKNKGEAGGGREKKFLVLLPARWGSPNIYVDPKGSQGNKARTRRGPPEQWGRIFSDVSGAEAGAGSYPACPGPHRTNPGILGKKTF